MPEPAVATPTGSRPGRRSGLPSTPARVIAGLGPAPARPAVTRAATFPVQSGRSAPAGEIQRLADARAPRPHVAAPDGGLTRPAAEPVLLPTARASAGVPCSSALPGGTDARCSDDEPPQAADRLPHTERPAVGLSWAATPGDDSHLCRARRRRLRRSRATVPAPPPAPPRGHGDACAWPDH